METKPFQLGRSNSKPEDWINSTIDIAVNILSHRLKTMNDYAEESMRVNNLITREILGRCIWKYSEAFGKFKGCPFWSIEAYNFYIGQKSKSTALIAKNLRHEHTYPQILLIKKMWKLNNPTKKIIRALFDQYAIATVVTKEENLKLNSSAVGLRSDTISEKNIWLRYNNDKITIKVMENPIDNIFYKHHYKAMKEAQVIQ